VTHWLWLLLVLVSTSALAEARQTIPVMIPDKGLVEMTDKQYWAYVRPMARLPVMSSDFVFGKKPRAGYHIVHDRDGHAFYQIQSPRRPMRRGYTPILTTGTNNSSKQFLMSLHIPSRMGRLGNSPSLTSRPPLHGGYGFRGRFSVTSIRPPVSYQVFGRGYQAGVGTTTLYWSAA
jgi:hypothetical protein